MVRYPWADHADAYLFKNHTSTSAYMVYLVLCLPVPLPHPRVHLVYYLPLHPLTDCPLLYHFLTPLTFTVKHILTLSLSHLKPSIYPYHIISMTYIPDFYITHPTSILSLTSTFIFFTSHRTSTAPSNSYYMYLTPCFYFTFPHIIQLHFTITPSFLHITSHSS